VCYTRITEKDLQLLSALGRNPLGSIKALSKEMGLTAITTAKRLKQLYERGILINISAEICPPAVGLEAIIFFLEVPFRNINAVEEALDLHPYTRYRVRCLGFLNGIYVTFAVPQSAIPLIVEFIERLQELRLVDRFRYRMFTGCWSVLETDFSYYNLEDDKWEFDWEAWEKPLDKPPSSFEKTTSILHRLDKRDMRILRQLTIDSRTKRNIFAERAKVPSYYLSRRLPFYQEAHIITNYRVVIHRSASKLFATMALECDCSMSVTARFMNAVTRLPFQSTLVPFEDGFFLQTSIPSIDLPSLGHILQIHCDDVKVYWSDYDSSMRYWFWHEPYQDGEWISGRKYIVNDVIEELRRDMYI